MAVTLDHKVRSLECYTTYDQFTDVVVKVGWDCIGSAMGQIGPSSGSMISYSYPNTTQLTLNSESWVSGSGFVPYDQLTNEIVLGWVWTEIGSQKDSIDAYVTNQVNQMVSPTIVNLPLPWQQPIPPTPPSGSSQP